MLTRIASGLFSKSVRVQSLCKSELLENCSIRQSTIRAHVNLEFFSCVSRQLLQAQGIDGELFLEFFDFFDENLQIISFSFHRFFKERLMREVIFFSKFLKFAGHFFKKIIGFGLCIILFLLLLLFVPWEVNIHTVTYRETFVKRRNVVNRVSFYVERN